MRRLLILAAAASTICAAWTAPAMCANATWNVTGGGNWSTGSNWTPTADFANPVSGYSSSVFVIDDTNFDNAYSGNFSVVLGTSVTGGDNTQLYLTYVPVPEPATLTLAACGGAIALAFVRRPAATLIGQSRERGLA
jgi:hypothetical protein